MNYLYYCSSCQKEYYINHSMKEDFKTVCIECSEPTLKRKIEPAALSFKGEGWASKEIRANSMARKIN